MPHFSFIHSWVTLLIIIIPRRPLRRLNNNNMRVAVVVAAAAVAAVSLKSNGNAWKKTRQKPWRDSKLHDSEKNKSPNDLNVHDGQSTMNTIWAPWWTPKVVSWLKKQEKTSLSRVDEKKQQRSRHLFVCLFLVVYNAWTLAQWRYVAMSSDPSENPKCRDCGSLDVDPIFFQVFHMSVCPRCKEKYPERYSLITKTEAKEASGIHDKAMARSVIADTCFLNRIISWQIVSISKNKEERRI